MPAHAHQRAVMRLMMMATLRMQGAAGPKAEDRRIRDVEHVIIGEHVGIGDQLLLVRVPDRVEQEVDFCKLAKGGRCFAICADWMRTMWGLTEKCRAQKCCAQTSTFFTKISSDTPKHPDDKPYGQAKDSKQLQVPSEFQALPRTFARLHFYLDPDGALLPIDLRAVDVRGYPVNGGEKMHAHTWQCTRHALART